MSAGINLIAAIGLLLSAANAMGSDDLNPHPDLLTGLWQQVDEGSLRVQGLVRIRRGPDGTYSGVVEKIIPGPGEDPDPKCDLCKGELRGKRVLGMQVISGLRLTAAGLYEGGTIVDPDDGTVYRLRVRVLESGAKLEVRGYVGISLFGRSQVWPRAGTEK